MKSLIDRLRVERCLEREDYYRLLSGFDDEVLSYANTNAREVADNVFGKGVYVRGLIEVTNYCRNNCYYCGIRRDNSGVERYRLTKEQILECCYKGDRLGFNTFVLQGGEDYTLGSEWLVDLIATIRKEFPLVAITLSLGEKSKEEYKQLFDAGANRYLLRHETAKKEHYDQLHPSSMLFERRMECLRNLKEIGFQTGVGMMVGSPNQTVDNLVADIEFITSFMPQMIGIGPFIPQINTPFSKESAGSVDMTLMLISILRMVLPNALIPSTTAVATLSETGHRRGVLAGANVIMPNLTTVEHKAKYALYDNKKFTDTESIEGVKKLDGELNKIGYHIDYQRGDFK